MTTVAEHIIGALKDAGVRRLFGMPGGGSNADLVEAAAKLGLPFSLAHTETASAFMASAQAEITGKPGACIATLGPGVASIMNGVAHAFLDRVPLAVITDCHPQAAARMQHQRLPHGSLFSSITKFSAEIGKENACETLHRAMDALSTAPPGPVHLDMPADVSSLVAANWCGHSKSVTPSQRNQEISDPVREILRAMRRPAILVGLGARDRQIAVTLQSFCEHMAIPALVTYKAKGVVPDDHAWFGGVLTNGALERDLLQRADGFIAIGLDPVELLPVSWRFSGPVISVNPWPIMQEQIPIAAELTGEVGRWLREVEEFLPRRSEWSETEISQLVQAQRNAMRPRNRDGQMCPQRVVEIAAEVYPNARITVDAGAHMFSVMSLWPAKDPGGVLISNGLSTMGFALPAAIGVSLLDSSQPTLAFTGDGGLLMCLGELRTAAREKLPLRIIVFDDGALSLIKIKQIKRGYRTDGVTIGDVSWETLATSMGVRGSTALTEEAVFASLRESATYPGPVLIAAKISDETYPETMRALRG